MLRRRYSAHDAAIFGHELVRKRLLDSTGFRALTGGEDIAGVARVPSHRATRAGRDAYRDPVPAGPGLRRRHRRDSRAVAGVGSAHHSGTGRQRWYTDRLLPTLWALAETDPERILVTHGRAVLRDGRRELERALAREPWQPRGGG